MRHHRAHPAAALLSLTVLSSSVLAGCGGDSSVSAAATPSSESPSATPSSSTPSPTPTADPSPAASPVLPRDRMRATRFHKAALASSAARTPDEKAAVTAWMAYWQAVTDTLYYDREVPTLSRVTSTAARSEVLNHLSKNKAQQQRVVGWARDHVTSVRVSGSRATLRDCTENFTFSVDEEGTPDTRPTPYYDVRGTLAKQGGRWVVTDFTSKDLSTTCL